MLLTAASALALTAALVAGQTPAPQAPSSPPAESAWPDDKPFERFFQNTWHDLRTLPSMPTLIILGAGGAAAGALHQIDDDAARAAEEAGTSGNTKAGDVIGNGWFQGGAAVATYVVGRVTHNPRVTHTGSDLIRAQVLNALITTTLKVAVDRERPSGSHYSFPSGHTSATFASAAVLHNHFGWKVGAPAYAVASFVGWTRVRDGQHWVSDVVFGAAVGLASGYTVTLGHRARDWKVVPVKTSGGGAVFVVKEWQ